MAVAVTFKRLQKRPEWKEAFVRLKEGDPLSIGWIRNGPGQYDRVWMARTRPRAESVRIMVEKFASRSEAVAWLLEVGGYVKLRPVTIEQEEAA